MTDTGNSVEGFIKTLKDDQKKFVIRALQGAVEVYDQVQWCQGGYGEIKIGKEILPLNWAGVVMYISNNLLPKAQLDHCAVCLEGALLIGSRKKHVAHVHSDNFLYLFFFMGRFVHQYTLENSDLLIHLHRGEMESNTYSLSTNHWNDLLVYEPWSDEGKKVVTDMLNSAISTLQSA